MEHLNYTRLLFQIFRITKSRIWTIWKMLWQYKSFYKGRWFIKKNEISKNIRFCSKPVLKGYNCGSEAYNFGRRIEANFACWSLENWVSLDWCIYPAFNPSMINFLELNHDILLYNNLPISKVLSYSTGNISLL